MRRKILSAVLGATRPLARLSASAALLGAGACAAASVAEEPPAALDPAQRSAEEWQASADRAEAEGRPAEALACLTMWAERSPEGVDADYWRRRLRLAARAGDARAQREACARILASAPEDDATRFALAELLAADGEPGAAVDLLDHPFTDPAAELRAWRFAAGQLEAQARFADAAALMEKAARHSLAGANAAAWWERASDLWERAGDRAAATRAIEQALSGVDLAAREAAALDRLRAFELGQISTVADAKAVLRFHVDAERRLAAARFLAGAAFDDAVPVFARALADPDARILRAALLELAARVTPAEKAFVTARALPFLDHADVEVRAAALVAVGAAGGAAQIPRLLQALTPEDRVQFRAARRALEALTGHFEEAPLDPDLAARQRLRAAWLAWWKQQGGA